MKKEYKYYNFWKVFGFVLLFPLILSGCIKDPVNDCGCFTTPSIRVVAVSPEGTLPVDPTDVESLILYVFNKDGKFITTLPAVLDEVIKLDYPLEKGLQVVALANGTETNEDITEFIEGNMISTGTINLKKLEDYLTMAVYGSPSDLFWGKVEVPNDSKESNVTILEIKRIVAKITVKIRGLKEFTQITDDNFKVVVEAQYNKVSFEGALSGTATNYLPQGGTFILVNNVSQLEIPSFDILSSPVGTSIRVKIYHNDILIDTVSTDEQGNPLTAYNGVQTEIRINYSGSLTVTVIRAKWEDVLIWKDFS